MSSKINREIWQFKDLSKKNKQRYKVNISCGKSIDIFSLKYDVVKNLNSLVSYVKSTRTSLYKSQELEKVRNCPVCKSSAANSIFRTSIYGGCYHQCLKCSHCFIINRPKEDTLKNFYSRNIRYGSQYRDKRTLQIRIKQVVMPKARWMLGQFKLLYRRKPNFVLDVGAGGGYFVYACRQLGIKAQGVEPSEPSRRFCRENFGFNLEATDFMKIKKIEADIITFWGVIEHVPQPLDLLKKAYSLLHKKNIVIAEVPRWDSFGSAIQRLFTSSVVRHLDPLGHINVFTDASLCTAFEISGFNPVAAWYFGMDSYELAMQLFYRSKNYRIIESAKNYITYLQETIDQARLSDTLVLAGVPKNNN